MFVVKAAPTTRYAAARQILKTGMIHVIQDKAPGKVKGGAIAMLFRDTGEVWFTETKNFNNFMAQIRANACIADCVKQAQARAANNVEVWVLTQPDRFDAESIRQQLEDADLLASRKARNMNGPGVLYTIRHDITLDYFVTEDRTGGPSATVLNSFLKRAQKLDSNSRNVNLNRFITEQAKDILEERNFTITEIARFTDADDAWLKRQCYIDECTIGTNLNWKSVD